MLVNILRSKSSEEFEELNAISLQSVHLLQVGQFRKFRDRNHVFEI